MINVGGVNSARGLRRELMPNSFLSLSAIIIFPGGPLAAMYAVSLVTAHPALQSTSLVSETTSRTIHSQRLLG